MQLSLNERNLFGQLRAAFLKRNAFSLAEMNGIVEYVKRNRHRANGLTRLHAAIGG
jgi:hypothetical protein